MALTPVTRKFMFFKLSQREAVETYGNAVGTIQSYEELMSKAPFEHEISDDALDSGLSNLFLSVLESTKGAEGNITLLSANPYQEAGVYLLFT